MSSQTINQFIVQTGGQLNITDSSTNIVNNFTIENFHEITQTLKPLTGDQKNFLDTYLQKQKATTLDGFPQPMLNTLPKIDTILKSVCLMWWTEANKSYSGTGFFVEIQGAGIAFVSAGHNFTSILSPSAPNNPEHFSLKNIVVHFGCVDGTWLHANDTPLSGIYPLMKGEPMSLGQLLEPFKVCGSVSYFGRRILFKNGNIVHYEARIGDVQKEEDYSVLLLTGDNVTSQLNAYGLGFLQCGHGSYLDNNDAELVAILGHPVCDDPDDKRALRLSFGTERHPDKISASIRKLRMTSSFTNCLGNNPSIGQTRLHSLSKGVINNYIYYNNDTLPGNSGSPVIGRGNNKAGQAYCVKAIHVSGFDLPNTNIAQNIKKIREWIDIGRNHQEDISH